MQLGRGTPWARVACQHQRPPAADRLGSTGLTIVLAMMRIHSPPSLPSLLLLLLAVPLCTSTDPRPPRGTLIWPKPQRHDIAAGSAKGRAEAHGFAFNATGAESAILTAAFRRYRGLSFPSAAAHGSSAAVSASAIPALVALDVNVSSSELGLGLSTSENYTLTISFPRSSLVATTVFGALRGLETFSQLLQDDGTISAQTVTDWPRFPFRAVRCTPPATPQACVPWLNQHTSPCLCCGSRSSW